MKKWMLWMVFAGFLVVLGGWGWQYVFPKPEVVIRKRMLELARTVSFQAGDGNLSKLSSAQKITTFFTMDADIVVDGPGRSQYRINGHSDLLEAAIASRRAADSLLVEFLDISVELGASANDAAVSMTIKGRVSGDRDYFVQEVRVFIDKLEGKWLIKRIETVKVLTQAHPSPPLTAANSLCTAGAIRLPAGV